MRSRHSNRPDGRADRGGNRADGAQNRADKGEARPSTGESRETRPDGGEGHRDSRSPQGNASSSFDNRYARTLRFVSNRERYCSTLIPSFKILDMGSN
jgi:hypothetical protein